MALGKRQRLDLDEMTGLVLKDPTIFRLEIVICPWQRFTREAGGGSGHAVLLKAFECYEEGDYQYRDALLRINPCSFWTTYALTHPLLRQAAALR